MKHAYTTWRDFYHDQFIFAHNALIDIEKQFSHNRKIMKIINKRWKKMREQDSPQNDAIDYNPKSIKNRWRTFRKPKCPSK